MEASQSAREGVRRELDDQISRLRNEYNTEREAREQAENDVRQLRAELVGKDAKQRRFTNEGGDGTDGGEGDQN